jgi:3-deoxy-D-manno-octulosonic-acid transferase
LQDDLVFVAGSTHDDEEINLIKIYKELKNKFPNLYFIIAPRDIERADEIKNLFNNYDIDSVKRTDIEKKMSEKDNVLILNTIGELAQIYSLADLVFVGGSMMGKGGHNILEPAAHGKLVFFGPDMSNFKDSTRLLLKNNVGIQVNNWEELKQNFLYFLNNRQELKEKGNKARRVILKNRGASKRIVESALRILK